MNSAMADASSPQGNSDYDALPEPIKMVVSQREYLWLSDDEKARLEQDLTEPEWV